ncbi:STAS domain-containing protein [Amycolatopsis tucumanensis]|uniref:STAS domain-containing protein n=1 Tax=Amycolatopsis tucumanensis TaxID=401106 RepID=A0ABP7HQM0_9PSEU|nr:STAS domain-containing protein [Amycolatopsis tucumanensis]MCF6421213.1 STAS domain-containing protein [Amycolatopsis tucumanensis]
MQTCFDHPPRALCRVQVRRTGTGLVLSVHGEVDLEAMPVLEDALATALREAPGVLVVDLTGVGFLAACGLRALVETHLRGGTRLRIVADGISRRVLELSGLTGTLAVYTDVAHAEAGVA